MVTLPLLLIKIFVVGAAPPIDVFNAKFIASELVAVFSAAETIEAPVKFPFTFNSAEKFTPTPIPAVMVAGFDVVSWTKFAAVAIVFVAESVIMNCGFQLMNVFI